MTTESDNETAGALTPLENFLRAYLQVTGGDWDEVESQVYDVLAPPDAEGPLEPGGVLRLSFDPEALPEHPGSQLAGFGTPLVDAFLSDAVRRGRAGRFHLAGLNLAPHDLAGRAGRSVRPEPPLFLRVERARVLDFPQALFWFQAEFTGDCKEQVIVPLGIDTHYLREVRHLDRLVDPARLAEQPPEPLPETDHASLEEAYLVAREQVLRSVAAVANVRARDLRERGERQVARVRRYYEDLRLEVEAPARGRQAADAEERLAARRDTIEREEGVRVAELRRKMQLQVQLRLQQVLVVFQPKVLVDALLCCPSREPIPVEIVWDPLVEAIEAPRCPSCGRPCYRFRTGRLGRIACDGCANATTGPARGS